MTAAGCRIGFAGLVTCLCLTTGVAGQKNKPAPSVAAVAGQAVINCAGPADATTDGVCGDGSNLYVDRSLANGDAGVLVGFRENDGQFRLRFDPLGSPVRALTAYLSERLLPLLSFECVDNCLAADAGGAPISHTTVTAAVLNGPNDARMQTTMRDARGREIDGGPAILAIGQSVVIDVLIGFDDPNGNGYRWGLYWSPINYPGSNPATITRTGSCTWEIEADATDVMGLRLFNTGTGKNSTRSEGRFHVPFSLTFTADPASMPGGCEL